MAVALGTNSGFCATSPDADPGGISTTIDNRISVTHDTSPAGSGKITEVGWWCDNATEEANFEVGLYDSDGAAVPGEAGTLLYADRTHAKGTDAGWKKVTGLSWPITENHSYWIAVQLDDCATTTLNNYATSDGTGFDIVSSRSTLADPMNGGALQDADGMIAFYAVWEAAASGLSIPVAMGGAYKATTPKIIIDGVYKTISSAKIMVNGAWKAHP
jgi:hypothetical protein